MMNKLPLLTMAIGIASCSTPYQEMGFTGGVRASQLDSRTFNVVGRGNAYTSFETINDYVMLKAAEVTKQQGYDVFAIVDGNDLSQSYLSQISPGQANSQFFGSSMTTTYNAPTMIPIRKAGSNVTIKLFHSEEVQAGSPNIYVAEEVIQFVGPRVR